MRFCVAAAITVVLGACEPSPAAQIVVTLDTDLRVASELTAVVVRTSSCGARSIRALSRLTPHCKRVAGPLAAA